MTHENGSSHSNLHQEQANTNIRSSKSLEVSMK